MGDDQKVYMPSLPLQPGDRYGILSDFEPGTRTLPAGFQIAPPFRPIPVHIVLEKDVAVTLRDGVTIYVDVLRPAGTEPVPVIVAWSPYGKGQGTSTSVMGVFGLVGLDNGIVSGLAKFEAPDPAYWCARGYAICNPDIRGVVDSDGDSVLWDRQEGRDCHDLIEWLAEQEWCSGKVGMSGTSYLAVAQWFTAAEQPPHLAAINPWEGVSDVYRDLVLRGGMPDTGFARQLQDGSFFGKNQKEDIIAEAERYPLIDRPVGEQDPRVRPDHRAGVRRRQLLQHAAHRRHVPRLAPDGLAVRSGCASTTARSGPTTTTRPTSRTCAASSTTTSRTRTTAGSSTPRVRYARPRPAKAAIAWQSACRMRSLRKDVTSTKYYLDGRSRSLRTVGARRSGAGSIRHAVAKPGLVSFTIRFDEETAYGRLPQGRDLWVEAQGADDMDLFVLIQKLDALRDAAAGSSRCRTRARCCTT